MLKLTAYLATQRTCRIIWFSRIQDNQFGWFVVTLTFSGKQYIALVICSTYGSKVSSDYRRELFKAHH